MGCSPPCRCMAGGSGRAAVTVRAGGRWWGATAREVGAGLAVAALGSVGLGLLMATVTEAAYPWPDATLTAFSLLAQLWMALKRWQCWVLWIVVDTLYVVFFVFQEYWLTAGLYGLFTLLAVMGLREWRQARAAVHDHAAPADS